MNKKAIIRLLVVDDHPAFRTGLITLIHGETDMQVIGETGEGREAVELFQKLRPDIVLMDLRLTPEFSGVEAIIALRKEFPDCRVVVVTTYDTDEDIYRAIQSGAQSYILKDTPKSDLVNTIRAVYAGERPLPQHVANRLANRLKREELTPRELEVLQLLVKGRSNKEIAATLFISEDTVKSRMKNVFAKLDVQDRTEAAIAAVRQGIVHL